MRVQPTIVLFVVALPWIVACGGDGAGSDPGDGGGDPATDGSTGDAPATDMDPDTASGDVDAVPDALPDAVVDAVEPGGTGSLVGTVYSPNAEGLDVVPFARLAIEDGPSATADQNGQFEMTGVPAGEPLGLLVSGPSPADDVTGLVYGTNYLVVRVPRDGSSIVLPHLLKGCRSFVSAADGGEAGSDACAGGGGLSVSFPADAFETVDGDAFTGVARIEMTAVDPTVAGDYFGLPEGPDSDAYLAGGLEVRLLDDSSGEPIALADGVEATIRMAIGELPDGLDLSVETFDVEGATWIDHGEGTVEIEAERRYLVFDTDHFTMYRAVACCIPPARTCLMVRPEVCLSAGNCQAPRRCGPDEVEQGDIPCGSMLVTVRDLTLPGWSPEPLQWQAVPPVLDQRLCLNVNAGSVADVDFYYADVATGTTHRAVRRVTAPSEESPPGCTPNTCHDFCDPSADGLLPCRIQLGAQSYGCVTGTLRTGSDDPIVGPLRALLDGNLVGTVVLPPPSDCAGDDGFCGRIPADASAAASGIELQDSVGNTFAVTPEPSSVGCDCNWSGAGLCRYRDESFMCGGGVGTCQDLGEPEVTCEDQSGQQDRACVRAFFDRTLNEDTASCPGAGNYELELDATPSTGGIAFYEWFVYCEDGACSDLAQCPDEGDCLLRDQIGGSVTLEEPLCLTHNGGYRVELLTTPAGRSLVYVRARATQRVRLPPVRDLPPCTFTATPHTAGYVTEDCTLDWTATPPTIECEQVISGNEYELNGPLYDGPCGFPCRRLPPFLSMTESTRRAVATGDTSTTTATFDAYGNTLTTVTESDAGTSTTTYVPTPSELPTTIDWDTGSNSGQYTLTYRPDDQLDTLLVDDHLLTHWTYVYDAGGRLTRIDLANATQRIGLWDLTYDDDGNLVSVFQSTDDGTPVLEYTFTYDCW